MLFSLVDLSELSNGSLGICDLEVGLFECDILFILSLGLGYPLSLAGESSHEHHSRHDTRVHIVVIAEEVVC